MTSADSMAIVSAGSESVLPVRTVMTLTVSTVPGMAPVNIPANCSTVCTGYKYAPEVGVATVTRGGTSLPRVARPYNPLSSRAGMPVAGTH